MRSFEENGIVITVKYPDGKELTVVGTYYTTVKNLTVMAAGNELYIACDGSGRKYLSMDN